MFNNKKLDVLLALATQNKQKLDELETEIKKITNASAQKANKNIDKKAKDDQPTIRAEDYDKRTPQDPTYAAFLGEKDQLLAQQREYIKRHGHASSELDNRLRSWDYNYKELMRAIIG